jgi:hypothetical protein
MKGKCNSKDRNELKLKISKVFEANIQMLSSDLREMLLDDLVTAFENRVKVLSKVESDVRIEAAVSVYYETVQA